jgi:hypothetical protein
MNLNDLLIKEGIDPQHVLVLRHRPHEPELKVVPIIEFLAFESNNVLFHKEGTYERVAGLCLISKNEASAVLNYYGA